MFVHGMTSRRESAIFNSSAPLEGGSFTVGRGTEMAGICARARFGYGFTEFNGT
jgi:hypothetical protein